MPVPFFDLRATHNPHRWFLPVTDDLVVGPPQRRFLFGGVGLAAAIEAMEKTCGREVSWATAHYLSFARPGSIIDLDVWVPVEGKLSSQANVVLHVDDKKIITVNAALGARDGAHDGQWLAMPTVPSPDQCEPVEHWRAGEGGLQARFDFRVASGYFKGGPLERTSDGRMLMWMRARDDRRTDSGLLAVVADFVSVGISNALGRRAGGNSLDNTIRFAKIEDSEWMLCDIRIETIHRGVVHGVMHIFSERGTLMATASQSLILRIFDEES